MIVPAPPVVDRLLPWLLRLTWIVVLVTGGSAIDGATSSRADVIGDVARYGALTGWIVGVASMAVPAVVSLTAVRLLVPLAVPIAAVTLGAGTDTVDGLLFCVVSLVSSMIAFSADLGRVFVQASAYGEEDRHLLRPPAAYALAAIATWSVWATLVISAPMLIAAEHWVLGPMAAAGALASGVLGWPRWHRLARRWFVLVPIGLVIHDQLVLAETVMLRRQELAGLRLAPAGTEAADLTGPASGHAVEITTTEPTTVVFAASPTAPSGTVIHLRSCLIAPSRPGRALTAAAVKRLPVG